MLREQQAVLFALRRRPPLSRCSPPLPHLSPPQPPQNFEPLNSSVTSSIQSSCPAKGQQARRPQAKGKGRGRKGSRSPAALFFCFRVGGLRAL